MSISVKRITGGQLYRFSKRPFSFIWACDIVHWMINYSDTLTFYLWMALTYICEALSSDILYSTCLIV